MSLKFLDKTPKKLLKLHFAILIDTLYKARAHGRSQGCPLWWIGFHILKKFGTFRQNEILPPHLIFFHFAPL